jgi:hypothetical protein
MPTLRILLHVAKSCILRCCSNDACLLNAILVYRSAEDCHNSLPSLLLTPYGLLCTPYVKKLVKTCFILSFILTVREIMNLTGILFVQLPCVVSVR